MQVQDTPYCRPFAAEAEMDDPRAGRSFPAPFGIEEDEPIPLPGIPPERQVLDAVALGHIAKIHAWRDRERLPADIY